MECSNCGSLSAQLHTLSSGGTQKTVCLCKACYEKLYARMDASELFAHLFGSRNAPPKKKKVCPSCGMALDSFLKNGLLGCAGCYSAFRDEVLGSVRYCQRSGSHCGKKPGGTSGLKYDLVREQEAFRAQLFAARREGDAQLEWELSRRLEEVQAQILRAEAAQEKLREAERKRAAEEEEM